MSTNLVMNHEAKGLFSNRFLNGLYSAGDGALKLGDRVVAYCRRVWKNSYDRDLAWNEAVDAVKGWDAERLRRTPQFFPGYHAAVWRLIDPKRVGFRAGYERVSEEQVEKDAPNPGEKVFKTAFIACLGILTAPFVLPCVLFGLPVRYGLVPKMNEIVSIPSTAPCKVYGESFSILTQNIAGTEFEIMNVENNMRSSKERCLELIRYIEAYLLDNDVFCMQEAFAPENNDRIGRALAKRGYWTIYQAKPKRVGMDSGLFIASRYPIVAAVFERFTHASGYDADANKGVLVAKLRLREGLSAFVANTHMQASGDHPKSFKQAYPDEYLGSIHREQLSTIRRTMDRFIAEERPLFTILAGDFNISGYSSLFGSPVAYANGIDLKPLEKFHGFHELTDDGRPLTEEQELAGGTGVERESPSYRFASERFREKIRMLVPDVYRVKLNAMIQRGLGFYEERNWGGVIMEMQALGVPAGLAGEIVKGIKEALKTFPQTIYRESGAIDHIFLKSESPEKFYRQFQVERSTGVMMGKGGVVSDHAYVQVRTKKATTSC